MAPAPEIAEYALIIDIFAKWFKLKFGNQPDRDAHGRFAKKGSHA